MDTSFSLIEANDFSPQNSRSEVVLVNGPRCQGETSNGAIQVEPESCQTVNLDGKEVPRSVTPPESCFGAHDDEVHELQDCKGQAVRNNNHSSDDEVHELQDCKGQAVRNNNHSSDTSREHGYKYEFSSDEDDDDHEDEYDIEEASPVRAKQPVSNGNPLLAVVVDSPSGQKSIPYVYLLGKTYHPIRDYSPRRTDESSLFWFTYRCDFPEIAPYKMTTDAGWGCMLRSAQMMLAQTLRVHFKSRTWRPPQMIANRRHDPFMQSIMTWFADFASKGDCIFSLHNMVAAGLAKYETLPGEWYGPGTACYVMRDLCQLYEEQRKKAASKNKTDPVFRVHVASQGTVYRDAVENLMTRDAVEVQKSMEEEEKTDKESAPLSHPLDPLYNTPAAKEMQSTCDLAWDTGLLLMIPLRLGLKTFNKEYALGFAHCFGLKQSVGVLGGRPRGARWFYGANSDATKLFGLDPHTIQMAPQRRSTTASQGKPTQVTLSEDYLRSVHTTNPDSMNLLKVDPSIALGFYCKDRANFESLCLSVEQWNKANPELPETFIIADAAPDYSANGVSAAMHEMMTGEEEDMLEKANGDDMSDADEYVLL